MVVVLLLLTLQLSTSLAFDCYTGDLGTLRRKTCPSMGADFTDTCFKFIGPVETQRGCFNSHIAMFITESKEVVGCHEVPEKYASGYTVCVCARELCNGALPMVIGGPRVSLVVVASVVAVVAWAAANGQMLR